MPDVVVVGGGAAGIFAAWRAATLGAQVLLVEKTSRLGTKILISGGGKCNVAHAGPLEDVLRAFRPNEARFLRPACYRLPNDRIVDLMTSRGLRVYTRPDGRVFPIDQTAKDVMGILRHMLDEAGVEVRLESPVQEIVAESGKILGLRTGDPIPRHQGYRRSNAIYGAKALLEEVLATENHLAATTGRGFIPCRRVVLATGGSSYPNSGTTGDGWPWAAALGHSLVKIRGALAPIYLRLEGVDRAGVALRDIVLKARHGGKEVARWRGDLLFTHQGISGPTALGVSRLVAEHLERGETALEVDLLPDIAFEPLAAELLAYGTAHPKRLVATFLEARMPERLVDELLTSSGIEPTQAFAKLDRKARNRLASNLKAWPLGPVKAVPIEKGEVAAGGVSLDEVDPQTMRSRLVEGLYLCGEILDLAGPVGGYNLQAAFATGYVAGETAAKDAL